jgi:long-subunit acyl-CoA synthetase (AMP-forming)
MTMPPAFSSRDATLADSVAEAFLITADRQPDEVALQTLDGSTSISWAQWRARSEAIAGGLRALGLERGDCVALMLTNRPEFHVVDLAATFVGATPFSLYATSSPEQVEYVMRDSAARILVTEGAFLPTIRAARANLPGLEHVVVLESETPDDCVSLETVEASGHEAGFDAVAAAVALRPDDVLTLIYTSGTTGPPKGVQLSHRNLLAAVRSVAALVDFPGAGGKVISWLPAAHIGERAAHHYLPMVLGLQVTSCPDPREILTYVRAVQPSWFFAVPRIWEKIKAALEASLTTMTAQDAADARAAIDAAVHKVRLEQRGAPVPEELAATVAAADARLFAAWREQLGLGAARAVSTGAAPTPIEVLEFFHAIGLPVGEIWGMSETCGGGCANPTGRMKLGTVGPPAPGIEIRLADDGEVLVRSETVMLGYRNRPDKTAEAIDEDGWLHTGDIGAFDEDGYLRIVDRKKEIIINAAGKNMSPANIEATVKSASPLIGQAVCIGDGRPYNTALIVLDPDYAPTWAARQGMDPDAPGFASSDIVTAAIQAAIDAANARLARVEQIKTFTVIPGDWLPGGDELTPTMKLKRKPIAAKYAAAIDAMYAGR